MPQRVAVTTGVVKKNPTILIPPSNFHLEPHPSNKCYECLSIYYPHHPQQPSSKKILIVVLDRPKKRNAINSKLWLEIGSLFRSIGSSVEFCSIRCVLLIGNGVSFCTGIDLEMLGGTNDEITDDTARRYLSNRPKIIKMQESFTALEDCPIPIVAAIHGHCIGAGVDLICCCDIRICSPTTNFAVKEVKLGLAADMGTLQRLPKIVGYGSYVKELCLTGDNFSAMDATKIGFVSRFSQSDVTLMDEALQICEKVVSLSPIAVSGTKMSLNYSRDHNVKEGLEHIASHNAVTLMTEDLVSSFLKQSSTGKHKNGSSSDDDFCFKDLLPHAKL